MDEIPLNNINGGNKNGVDKFNQLSMELENESIRFRQDNIDNSNNLEDLETGERVYSAEDFKLVKYFENSQRQLLDNGHKVKKMGVSINNLTVVGQGAESSVIMDNFTPFRNIISLLNPMNWKKKNEPVFNILNNINGYIEDGKMLLVLGRPGSGCSTLLRVISNQRDSYVRVDGDIKYGNISAEKWNKFRGESIYTPEEDIHHPILTLHETLDFALKLKTPGLRLPEETKRNFRTKIYDLLASMYGLVNQRNTMVGNEYIRGLSGGERKRATIAEAMVSGSSITCWDCSTRGLDSASAYDYAKSLRIMSDTLGKTSIASFYQASDSIFNLFDKVMILDKGRCIYFGSTKEAKQYFVDMGFECPPRKSIPDFLTSITNPQERTVRESHKGPVPETSADFEEAWKNSQLYHKSTSEQKEYEEKIESEQPSKDFIEQVLNEKSKTSSKKSEYSASFVSQVLALTSRQSKLLWGDKFTLCSNLLTILVLSIIYGTVYYDLDNSIDGLFTRGGAIFNSIFMMSLISEGELHGTYYGRRILQKQKSYALYRPSAYYISQVLIDIPYSIAQALLHSIICYFMYNLDRDAGKFFIFFFTLAGVSLASCSLHRALGNFTPSMFVGQNVLNILFMFMINYFGYTIPYDKQHPWFKWFTWCFSLSYAFKGLMGNEFLNQNFTCDNHAIPTNSNQTDYRICPIAGSVQGELTVSGATYLDKTYQFDVNDRAFNVGMVFVFWIFYIILNLIAIEVFDWSGNGYTKKVYKKGKAPKLNDVEEEKKINQTVREATEHMKESLKIKGGIFTWKDIKYTVPVKGGERLLLDNVMGWIKPGQMTALMGSSGAGKTTLLDVLAKRKTLGTVEGESYLNGNALEIDFERITGYIEQMDVHNPGLTVREALRFSARLRQEPSIPLNEKYEYVERVLEMMEMKHLGDALVGSLETGVGISVEERKRLTIGLELVAKPHILFLDEPTSGLDSQSAFNIVKFIRKLADAGMPLVCTIHQPSSTLFEYFDRLLLLAKGGKTVYFGDIGKNAKTLTDYFERNGGRAASLSENPAEYILDVIGAGVHGSTDIDWPQVWNQSLEFENVKRELDATNQESIASSSKSDREVPREFATGFATQFKEVYIRLNKIWFRDPFYTIGGWLQMAVSGLIVGFTFFNLQNSSSDMNSRIFLAWENLILGVLLIYLTLPMFFTQKEYFKRDFASKYYSWHAFSISIILVEIPYIVVSGTIFYVTTYFTAGLNNGPAVNDFYYWIMLVFFGIYTVSFGQALGAMCVDLFLSISVLPIVLIYLFLFTGVQIFEKDLPKFYGSWLYQLNPCKYLVEGLVTSVLRFVEVTCTNEDLVKFTPPPNVTCEQYTQDFETIGKVVNIDNDPYSCGYCSYSTGSDYYENVLNYKYENRWRNFGILIAYTAVNIILIVTFVYVTRKSRR